MDRFTDFMVTDKATGDCIRADHLLEDVLERVIEGKPDPHAKKGQPQPHYTPEQQREARDLLARVGELKVAELGEALRKYGARAPDTGNEISEPFSFNLMFKTSIGPKGDMVGFMRPETAQGIFVNFK